MYTIRHKENSNCWAKNGAFDLYLTAANSILQLKSSFKIILGQIRCTLKLFNLQTVNSTLIDSTLMDLFLTWSFIPQLPQSFLTSSQSFQLPRLFTLLWLTKIGHKCCKGSSFLPIIPYFQIHPFSFQLSHYVLYWDNSKHVLLFPDLSPKHQLLIH